MLIKLPSDYNKNHGCSDHIGQINWPSQVRASMTKTEKMGDHHHNRMMAHVSDHLIQFKIKKIAQYKHVSLVARFQFRLVRFMVQIRDSPTVRPLIPSSI